MLEGYRLHTDVSTCLLFSFLLLGLGSYAALHPATATCFDGQQLRMAEYTTSLPHHRRSLQQLAAPSPLPEENISSNFLILAQDRTERRDPLDSFKVYRGGWDIRNGHYWASVGYTAAPGFVLAAAWLLLGLCHILLLCFCCCCCRDKLHGKHQGGNLFPFLFLLLFTGAAVAGCFLVYIGQAESHDELSNTLDYVVLESNGVVLRLHSVSTALSDAQQLTVLQFALPDADKKRIVELNQQIDRASTTLQNRTKENADSIMSALNSVRLAMIIVVGVMLLLELLGFLFSILGMLPLMYMLVFLGWFLVAGTWILCGIYIMLNNAVGDTCIAMQEWVANPSATTNLDDILPCVDIRTTNTTLAQSRRVENETVMGINTAITKFINSNPNTQLPLMCNPVAPELSPPSCVNVSNASTEWGKFACNQSNSKNCSLTPTVFDQLDKSATVVNALNNDIPFLLDLQNCVFVRQVFTTIQEDHCHPLRKYLKWQYIGLALISGGLMFAILLWVVFSRRRKHRFLHRRSNDQFLQKGTPQDGV